MVEAQGPQLPDQAAAHDDPNMAEGQESKDYQRVVNVPEFRPILQRGKFAIPLPDISYFSCFPFRKSSLKQCTPIEAHVFFHEEQVHHIDRYEDNLGLVEKVGALRPSICRLARSDKIIETWRHKLHHALWVEGR